LKFLKGDDSGERPSAAFPLGLKGRGGVGAGIFPFQTPPSNLILRALPRSLLRNRPFRITSRLVEKENGFIYERLLFSGCPANKGRFLKQTGLLPGPESIRLAK
jgi:hypothetical protein